MNTFFSKLITSSIALAGLAGALLASAEPAEARKMNSCQIKHSYCSERCIMNNDYGQIGACIQRTCDRQHPGCGGESLGGGGKGGKGGRGGFVANTKPTGPVASGPQSPRGPVNPGPFPPGGMKPKQNNGWGGSGPFVPGGMKPRQNGGLGPSGPVRMSSQGRR